jgi:predicted ATP-grasp superfamily ATP-dependent carboligase
LTTRAGPRLLLAGVSVRALARSATRGRLAAARFPGGIVALDYFGDWDLRALRDVIALSLRADRRGRRSVLALGRAARSLEWDACALAGGMENRPSVLEALQRRGTLLGNGAAAVRAVRDPAILFGFLRRAGIPHAPTRVRTGAVEAPGPGFLWKPRRSGGGGRIRVARAGETRPRGFYLQGRLEGRAGSAAFVAAGGETELVGVAEQIAGIPELGATGFRYAGSLVGPPGALLSAAATAGLEEAARALARRFGLRGLNGIDFVIGGDGVPRILEINPRWTASMELIEERRGVSLFDRHLQACCPAPGADREAARQGAAGTGPETGGPGAAESDTPPPGPGAAAFLAKGILYAEGPLRAGDPERLAGLGCRDIPCAGEPIDRGQPVCTIVVAGGSAGACREALRERAATVRRALRGAAREPARVVC